MSRCTNFSVNEMLYLIEGVVLATLVMVLYGGSPLDR